MAAVTSCENTLLSEKGVCTWPRFEIEGKVDTTLHIILVPDLFEKKEILSPVS